MTPSRPASPERVALPREAVGLPGLGVDGDAALSAGLDSLGLVLSQDVLAAIDAHVRLLAAWGRHVNLTAIRDPVQVMRLHVLDSLSAVAPVRERLGGVASVVDIGSGGGFPGIPFALGVGASRLTLVDSVSRKTRFLEVAAQAVVVALGDAAPVIEVRTTRAEALAASDLRATWDVAAMRAVGSLASCNELGLPLVRVGGIVACWKRDAAGADGRASADLRSEVAAARSLIEDLGGGEPEVVPVAVPGAPDHRLVLVRKVRPTPEAYTRSPTARRSAPIVGPSRGRRAPMGHVPRS